MLTGSAIRAAGGFRDLSGAAGLACAILFAIRRATLGAAAVTL